MKMWPWWYTDSYLVFEFCRKTDCRAIAANFCFDSTSLDIVKWAIQVVVACRSCLVITIQDEPFLISNWTLGPVLLLVCCLSQQTYPRLRTCVFACYQHKEASKAIRGSRSLHLVVMGRKIPIQGRLLIELLLIKKSELSLNSIDGGRFRLFLHNAS